MRLTGKWLTAGAGVTGKWLTAGAGKWLTARGTSPKIDESRGLFQILMDHRSWTVHDFFQQFDKNHGL